MFLADFRFLALSLTIFSRFGVLASMNMGLIAACAIWKCRTIQNDGFGTRILDYRFAAPAAVDIAITFFFQVLIECFKVDVTIHICDELLASDGIDSVP